MIHLDIDRVEPWRRNRFILKGYRPTNPSFIYCLKSLFWFHNESGNIFTHLFGTLMMSILSYNKLVCNSNVNYKIFDKLLFSGLFIACINCFLMSSLFHIFGCHSRRVYKRFAKLDYFGISLVMMTTTTVWLYYGFYYSPIAQKVYITLFSVYSIILLICSHFEHFSDPDYHKTRALLFLFDGLFALIPFLHYCHNTFFVNPLLGNHLFRSILLILLSLIINVSGTIIYILKIPERLSPYTFDFWFTSHQTLHLTSISAGVLYYHGITLLADIRLNFPGHQKT